MPSSPIDDYLACLSEPARTTLGQLRRAIHAIVPEAEECISYGMPAFRVGSDIVAGFAAFTNHLSYLPHSGSVLATLADDLGGYTQTKGSLHFATDTPLPTDLVEKLIRVRLQQT